MKRATVTIPDDLERELNAYLQKQDAPPSLTAVMQAALREYLQTQRLRERDYQPARGSIRITPAKQGSGLSNVSVNHDRYLAE